MTQLLDRLAAGRPNELNDEAAALAALDAIESAAPLPSPEAVRGRLPEKGVTVGLHALLARALAEDGDVEEADRVLLQIAERLNQAGFWRPLVRVVEPLLDRHPQVVGPLLVRIRAQGGPVPDTLLFRAHDRLPDHGLLAWEAARARQAAGEDEPSYEAAALALPELLEDKNFDPAEEAFLLLAGSGKPTLVPVLVKALDLLARQGEWSRFDMFLDLAGDLLSGDAGAPIAWPMIEAVWLKHPDPEGIRPAVVRLAEGSLAHYPNPSGLIRVARLNIPSEEPSRCLERLAHARRLPPGYFAFHTGWGIGEIRENDTETVVIDFPTRPLHRMRLETALRSLIALEPTDLRVLAVHDPEKLKRLVREEPATIFASALKQLPEREGKLDRIRKTLVPGVIPSTGWAGWWKKAREAVASDPRIDARRAYENIYRLREPGEEAGGIDLPVWNPKADTIRNLAVLDTFLEHHPDRREDLRTAFLDSVNERTAETTLPAPERAVAALWVERFGCSPAVPAGDLVTGAFEFNTLSKAWQVELADHLQSTVGWGIALTSRLTGIRRRALEALLVSGDLDPVAREVLTSARSRPEAAIHLLEEGPGRLPGDPNSWSRPLVMALVDLVEDPPRETYRKRALALLDEGSALFEHLRRAPLTEDNGTVFITRLKRWQSSDTYRFPLLDFLRQTGQEFIVEAVEDHRQRAAARLAARGENTEVDPYDGALVVTRHSLDRLEAERRRLGMELKTTIPRAIETARELGDLKENAEYHAAKAKQAEYARRFQDLEAQLQRVRLIEDLARDSGLALPGTEITLEPLVDGAARTIWMLGEGDEDLGPEVVSYKAPLGQALHRRREGETVELPDDGSQVAYRIAAVRERLP